MYSILTGPPKPSEKSSITAQLNSFKKFRSRTLIKLKAALSKEEEEPVTSTPNTFPLGYSLGDPCGSFTLAKHRSPYFAT